MTPPFGGQYWGFTVLLQLSRLRAWVSPPVQNLHILSPLKVCHQFHMHIAGVGLAIAGGSTPLSPQNSTSCAISVVQSPIPACCLDNYVMSHSYDQ